MSNIEVKAHSGSVEATINFARRGVDAARWSKDAKALEALEQRTVVVADARACSDRLSLESTGFALFRHASAVTDFYDDAAIKSRYVPEIEELVAAFTGARKVIVVDAVVRGAKVAMDQHPDARIWDYAFKAHTDGTGDGFLRRAMVCQPEAAAQYADCAFVEYNLWRPLAPVEQKPLAVCDASTVEPPDLVPAFYSGWENLPKHLRPDPLPPSDKYFHLAHGASQRWYYFPRMTPGEVLVFKQWDTNRGRPLCVPHTAFHDPATPPNAAPRLSIEARAVAFFGPQSNRLLELWA